MKVRNNLVLIVILIIGTSTLFSTFALSDREAKTQIVIDGTKYYALIIGVEKFENINATEYAHYIDDDAIAMYNMLNNSNNWKTSHIKLLLNENATKDNIRDNITEWLDDREDQDDVVIIYFVKELLQTRNWILGWMNWNQIRSWLYSTPAILEGCFLSVRRAE